MNRIIAKKISKDMLINLLGTGIGLTVLQLIIYPMIAKSIDADAYGQMQSIISVVYMISGTLGSTLCTTRLVREYKYQSENICGDYNKICVYCIVFSVLLLPVSMIIYGRDCGYIDVFLVILIGILNFASNYFAVGFRLKINYAAIFISRLLGSLGYLVGFVVFYFSHKWQFVFICSYLAETLYYFLKTNLIHEPYVYTKNKRKTISTFFNLCTSNLLSRSLTYFDKLLLYPVLGGAAVSVYYTANVFGKLIMMTIEPISNVVLSYLSKKESVSQKTWRTVVPIAALVCVFLYFISLIISTPIIRYFYPQWADEAIKLVPLTTLCLSISAFNNILYPFSLKLIDSHRQIVINGFSVLVYFSVSLHLAHKYYTTGFCIALLISYLIKTMCLMYYCIRSYKREK